MLRPSRFRTTTVVTLLLMLAALGTGLPHDHDQPSDSAAPVLLSRDHHTHGVVVLDQDERAPSTGPVFIVTLVTRHEPVLTTSTEPVTFRAESDPGPLDRIPPPSSPRAPPRSA